MAHCGECKYMGWKGLQRHCRHPNHAKPLKRWPGKCDDFVDWESKAMPGKEPKWPDPVTLSCHRGTEETEKNDDK